jgi:hypothetical protein
MEVAESAVVYKATGAGSGGGSLVGVGQPEKSRIQTVKPGIIDRFFAL